MKPAQTPQAAPEAPVRVEFKVSFAGGPKGRRQARGITLTASTGQELSTVSTNSAAPEPIREVSLDRLPKITRLLVLGHHFENLVREGVVKDYAEIARLTGLSRARVTQIVNLTLLAPEIQEIILESASTPKCKDPVTERDIRLLGSEACWRRQQRALRKFSLPFVLADN